MTTVIGVDIGQKRDPTAICLSQQEIRKEEFGGWADHFLVRLLERLPLTTPYPQVAERVAEVANRASQQLGRNPLVYVDATGVGQPVVDLIRERYAEVLPVYFTHGDRRTVEDTQATLGKAWLVSRLQTLLQTRRVHLPRTPEARVLAEELINYEIRVDQNANDKYGAFRCGIHDDLVTALGLAVQPDRPRKRWGAIPDPLW